MTETWLSRWIIKGYFTPQEVSEVIREALVYSEPVTKYKIKKYSGICRNFEKKYGMDSVFLWKKSIPENLEMLMISSAGTQQKRP